LTGLGTGVLGTLAAAALIAVLLVRPEALDLIGGRQAQLNPGPADQAPQPPAFSIPGQPFASANRLLELRSSSETGRGLLAYDAHTRRGVLILEEVPSSASGSEYSVQLVQAARRVELGSVTIDARGVGTFILPDPLPLDRPERIEVIQTRPEPGAAPLVLAATF
jgi:hypothetical protein